MLTKDVAFKIGLDENMTWLELKLMKYKLKIGLIWTDGYVMFDKVWNDFTKVMKLTEGDVCVFRYTKEYQKFKVVVLEKEKMVKINMASFDVWMKIDGNSLLRLSVKV